MWCAYSPRNSHLCQPQWERNLSDGTQFQSLFFGFRKMSSGVQIVFFQPWRCRMNFTPNTFAFLVTLLPYFERRSLLLTKTYTINIAGVQKKKKTLPIWNLPTLYLRHKYWYLPYRVTEPGLNVQAPWTGFFLAERQPPPGAGGARPGF